jgi:hypothetical protein
MTGLVLDRDHAFSTMRICWVNIIPSDMVKNSHILNSVRTNTRGDVSTIAGEIKLGSVYRYYVTLSISVPCAST